MPHIKIAWLLGIVFVVISMTNSSCIKENLDDLRNNPSDSTGVCDTSFMVSYNNDIIPILSVECYQCHDAAGVQIWPTEIRLDIYGAVAEQANNGTLVCAIKFLAGCTAMPFQSGTKIDACKIMRIEAWVNQKALEN